MTHLRTWIATAWLAGCGTTAMPTTDDTDTDDTTSDTDRSGGTDTDGHGGGDTDVSLSTFEAGRYRATGMRLVTTGNGLDLDGDGEIDNALPGVLNLVDIALPSSDLSVRAVDMRLASMLYGERVILLFDARLDGSTLTVDVLPGERDGQGVARPTADAYDDDGVAVESLTGGFLDATTFRGGPSPLAVPLVLEEGEPVLRARAQQAWMRGTMDDDGIDTFVAAAFTVDHVMTDVVTPLVMNAVDPDDQASTLSTARTIIELAADLDLNGTPALSGAFRIEGEATSW